jgi:hypothetical protein
MTKALVAAAAAAFVLFYRVRRVYGPIDEEQLNVAPASTPTTWYNWPLAIDQVLYRQRDGTYWLEIRQNLASYIVLGDAVRRPDCLATLLLR